MTKSQENNFADNARILKIQILMPDYKLETLSKLKETSKMTHKYMVKISGYEYD